MLVVLVVVVTRRRRAVCGASPDEAVVAFVASVRVRARLRTIAHRSAVSDRATVTVMFARFRVVADRHRVIANGL
jgi:hypothetical protein